MRHKEPVPTAAEQFALAEVITHLVPAWADPEAESKFFGFVHQIIRGYDTRRTLQMDHLRNLVTRLCTVAPEAALSILRGMDLSNLKQSKPKERVNPPQAGEVLSAALKWWRNEGMRLIDPGAKPGDPDGAPWWVFAADDLEEEVK